MKTSLASKILGTAQKVFLTFVLLLLTDGNGFRTFLIFLSRQASIRRAVTLVTDIPMKEAGAAFRAWSEELTPLSLALTSGLILLVILVRPGLRDKFGRALRNNLPVMVLLLLAGSSWLWSVDQTATLNGVFLAIQITLLGLYISQVYAPEEVLEVLVWTVALASIVSILVIWQNPELGIAQYGWRGIYTAKNNLGRLMAFGNAMMVMYWLENKGALFKRILALFFLILTGVLLVFSDSVTSLLALFAVYGTLFVYGAWEKWLVNFNSRTKLFVGAAAVAVGTLIVLNYERIFAIVNRSPTLTGRMSLWPILWTWFEQRPWLGFGYNAFWGQIAEPLLGWARHAHNGYIEIALGLGLMGLIIFLIALVIVWKRAFLLLRQKQQEIYLWPILALVYFTLANLTYSIAFENPDFHWALFVIVAGAVMFDKLPEHSVSREPSDPPAQATRELRNLP